jgi:hypothetical protein
MMLGVGNNEGQNRTAKEAGSVYINKAMRIFLVAKIAKDCPDISF